LHIINTQDEMSENDVEFFRELAQEFGLRWRSSLKKSVPPKLHLLESHVYLQMKRFRRMGIFCEDPIEREHHRRKILNTLFAPMRDWERIQRHIMKRDNQMTESGVQEAMIDAIQGTKRKSLIEKNHETVKLKKLSEKEVKKSKAEELFLES